jgi:Flp pilus assembly pilin Flp
VERVRSLLADESGQATSEYALTIIICVIVCGILAGVVKSGVLADQFKSILSHLTDKVRP